MYIPIQPQPSCARAWVAAATAISPEGDGYNVVIDVEDPVALDARHKLFLALDKKLREQHVPAHDRIAAHVLPYQLRALALDKKLDLHAVGRALYHLSQRRGYKSNRKAAKEDDDPLLSAFGFVRQIRSPGQKTAHHLRSAPCHTRSANAKMWVARNPRPNSPG